MTPEQSIADLDASLKRRGEDVVLTRSGVSVTVRARVTQKDRPDELASGSVVDDLIAIMSMTQIRAAGWHAGTEGVAPFIRDTAVPRRGDTAAVKGARYRVEAADVIAMDGIVVRINLSLKGGLGGA